LKTNEKGNVLSLFLAILLIIASLIAGRAFWIYTEDMSVENLSVIFGQAVMAIAVLILLIKTSGTAKDKKFVKKKMKTMLRE